MSWFHEYEMDLEYESRYCEEREVKVCIDIDNTPEQLEIWEGYDKQIVYEDEEHITFNTTIIESCLKEEDDEEVARRYIHSLKDEPGYWDVGWEPISKEQILKEKTEQLLKEGYTKEELLKTLEKIVV